MLSFLSLALGGGLSDDPMREFRAAQNRAHRNHMRTTKAIEALQKSVDDKCAHARADRYATALRAIIERADNGTLGSSKVQDMRKLAQEALDG